MIYIQGIVFIVVVFLLVGYIYGCWWDYSANTKAHRASDESIPELKKTAAKQQEQIDNLTRELEEVKRKLEK